MRMSTYKRDAVWGNGSKIIHLARNLLWRFFPLPSLCLSCSIGQVGILERSPSYCYFEDITNCSHAGVLPMVQVDLTMNGENLEEDK